MYDVAVIGGGASGMVAAICASRKGSRVVLFEKMPRLGKKVLATGGGRCNLTNETLTPAFYNPAARPLVERVLARFGNKDIRRFFSELGLWMYSDGGRIFPSTNQAASVMDVLEAGLSRENVEVLCPAEAVAVHPEKHGFRIKVAPARDINAKAVVLCCGGSSYPSLGSDGKGYALACAMGHTMVTPVPSTVPLESDDPLCRTLQGQKLSARVQAVVRGKPGKKAGGDLLFTKYGVSGTAVLDVSEEISLALHRDKVKDAELLIDLLPFAGEKEVAAECALRQERNVPADKFFSGLLPPKVCPAFSSLARQRDCGHMAHALKHLRLKVTNTRGWAEAEFTAGGINTKEVDPDTLESRVRPGLFFAGEILDVQGKRGGYNLAWAWASGAVAGGSAAGS